LARRPALIGLTYGIRNHLLMTVLARELPAQSLELTANSDNVSPVRQRGTPNFCASKNFLYFPISIFRPHASAARSAPLRWRKNWKMDEWRIENG
jgi:hypothetical protein